MDEQTYTISARDLAFALADASPSAEQIKHAADRLHLAMCERARRLNQPAPTRQVFDSTRSMPAGCFGDD